jgi:hypothetical protein
MSTPTEASQPTPTPKPALRNIYMYRMVQGNKVRWKFEVDNQMVIVNEGPAEMQNTSVQQSPDIPGPKPVSLSPDALAQYKKILEERGIKYSMTPSGQVIVNEIPSKEKMIMQFFDLNAPAPEVPGIEPIRERYKQEYDQAGGASCPSCQLNTLQRKYREILNAKIT